jgi:hypothetical protein
MNTKIYKLKNDYQGWVKGTLVLECEQSEEGIEYQDIGFELKNGWGIGYSLYNIPSDFLVEALPLEKVEVDKYLSAPWDYKVCPLDIVTSN